MNKTTNPAYLKLKEFVITFLKENIIDPNEFGENINSLLEQIRLDENMVLEWILGEHLDNTHFKTLGIVVYSQWNANFSSFSSIYKIGRFLIENKFADGKYLGEHTYSFVKRKKITTISYKYEPIKLPK